MRKFVLAIIFGATLVPFCFAANLASITLNAAGKVILLPSAARTATTAVQVANLTPLKCAHVIVNVTGYTAGSLTPHIQAYDPGSGSYYDVLVGTAISAAGTTVLKVCPGIAVIANGAASDFLPQAWQVNMVAGTADSITYSVGAEVSQ